MLTWRDFADGSRMPAVSLVAVRTLDKDGTVTKTLCKHLSANVVQPHTPSWEEKRHNRGWVHSDPLIMWSKNIKQKWEMWNKMSTYVSACELYCWVAVDVGQQAQTEALRVGGVCESVYCEGGLGSMEGLSDALVQLIVGDGAPEGRFTVRHRLQVCRSKGFQLGPWKKSHSGEFMRTGKLLWSNVHSSANYAPFDFSSTASFPRPLWLQPGIDMTFYFFNNDLLHIDKITWQPDVIIIALPWAVCN